MKEFFKTAILFAIFALIFSGLTSCTGEPGSASSDHAKSDSAGAPKKSSNYPPIATAVSEAEVKKLDGTTFKIADKKGKVILLNMWATWCGPCRAEMPALVRMHTEHGDNGFEVIGLNTDDESVEDINAFAADMKLNYPLVWADTKLQSALLKISQFGGIPQSFLIDRDGNLRGVFRGANPADIRKMEELVAKVVNGEDTAVPAESKQQQTTVPAEPKQEPDISAPVKDSKTK